MSEQQSPDLQKESSQQSKTEDVQKTSGLVDHDKALAMAHAGDHARTAAANWKITVDLVDPEGPDLPVVKENERMATQDAEKLETEAGERFEDGETAES